MDSVKYFSCLCFDQSVNECISSVTSWISNSLIPLIPAEVDCSFISLPVRWGMELIGWIHVIRCWQAVHFYGRGLDRAMFVSGGFWICARADLVSVVSSPWGYWDRKRGGQRGGLTASSFDEIWCLNWHTDRSPNSLSRDSWASTTNGACVCVWFMLGGWTFRPGLKWKDKERADESRSSSLHDAQT